MQSVPCVIVREGLEEACRGSAIGEIQPLGVG